MGGEVLELINERWARELREAREQAREAREQAREAREQAREAKEEGREEGREQEREEFTDQIVDELKKSGRWDDEIAEIIERAVRSCAPAGA